MKMIETKEECEQAAVSFGLSNTTAYEGQITRRPYGYIYASNDWLQWYSPDGSPHQSAKCGSHDGSYVYDCICKEGLSKHNLRVL